MIPSIAVSMRRELTMLRLRLSINHLSKQMSTDKIVTVATPTVPRQRSARGDGDTLRTDLLVAAADLIARRRDGGGVATGGRPRAGVSPTAVYRHFDDHVEFIRGAVDHCWSTFYAHSAVLTTAATTRSLRFVRWVMPTSPTPSSNPASTGCCSPTRSTWATVTRQAVSRRSSC